jgi:hypothetical protein
MQNISGLFGSLSDTKQIILHGISDSDETTASPLDQSKE